MIFRGMIAASCVVVALAAPAQAQDGCTSDLIAAVGAQLFAPSPDEPPYPLVEQDQSGSVHVHPQNAVPAAMHAVQSVAGYAGGIGNAVTAWVDCVD